MPRGNWNLQLLNQNSQRSYPLADTASRLDTTGAFRLPDDFIVAAEVPVHAGNDVDPGRFFVRLVGAYATGYSVVIGYSPADGSGDVDVATALIGRHAHDRNTRYALGGKGAFADTVGWVMVGLLDSIDLQPPGLWSFAFESTRLDPFAVRPYIRGVSSLTCVNGEERSAAMYGAVELVAGSNCQLVPVLVDGQDPVVVVNFLQGEGTTTDCVCEGDAASATPISRIDGVAGTPEGDFYLVAGECFRLDPIANGLRLVDTCSQPCCGCPELEEVTRDLVRLGDRAATASAFLARLGAVTDAMSTTVLGAKLGDRGCVQCD